MRKKYDYFMTVGVILIVAPLVVNLFLSDDIELYFASGFITTIGVVFIALSVIETFVGKPLYKKNMRKGYKFTILHRQAIKEEGKEAGYVYLLELGSGEIVYLQATEYLTEDTGSLGYDNVLRNH